MRLLVVVALCVTLAMVNAASFKTRGKSQKRQFLPVDLNCGYNVYMTKKDVEKKIVGGTTSMESEWPWLVSLSNNPFSHNHVCGGVLISPQWILTAAHCFFGQMRPDPFQHRVRLGEHSFYNNFDAAYDMPIDTIVVHPHYNDGMKQNDIALIRLAAPAMLGPNVNVACLPTRDDQYHLLTNCKVAGWGQTGYGMADVVQHVDAPVLDGGACANAYAFNPVKVLPGMFCAGHWQGGMDSCQGDSGGPHVCSRPWNPSQHILTGIVSWGNGCAMANQPGVYTRVQDYIDWIESTIFQYGY